MDSSPPRPTGSSEFINIKSEEKQDLLARFAIPENNHLYLQSRIDVMKKEQLARCLPDLIVDLAKYLAKKFGHAKSSSRYRLDHIENITPWHTDEMPDNAGIPSKFRAYMNRLQEFDDRRSQERWIEHGSSRKDIGELAELLLDPLFEKQYLEYHDLFRLIYGTTIEKKAQEHKDIMNEFLYGPDAAPDPEPES